MTSLQYLLELQRDWARTASYDMTTGIAKRFGGAYGLGIALEHFGVPLWPGIFVALIGLIVFFTIAAHVLYGSVRLQHGLSGVAPGALGQECVSKLLWPRAS